MFDTDPLLPPRSFPTLNLSETRTGEFITLLATEQQANECFSGVLVRIRKKRLCRFAKMVLSSGLGVHCLTCNKTAGQKRLLWSASKYGT